MRLRFIRVALLGVVMLLSVLSSNAADGPIRRERRPEVRRAENQRNISRNSEAKRMVEERKRVDHMNSDQHAKNGHTMGGPGPTQFSGPGK